MEKLKVLVLGDGLLGGKIIEQSGWDYISRKSNKGFNIKNIESTIPKGYDIIINCIANTDTYSTNKKSHWDTNYVFVDGLIKYCNKHKIKLVHISSDYVYTGSVSNATENDVPVHCNNWYGYTKLLSDGLVQLQCYDYLLCRCTHKSRPFPYENAWIDQIGNFDYVDVISKIIIRMVRNGLSGLFNVGTKTKTMYQLAKETADVGESVSPNNVPKNLSMNLNKLHNNIKPPFFSIAIPTYGYGGRGVEFLDFSLDILNRQTFKDFEVVLSDHSVDDTIKDVYNKWSKFMDIKYVRNDRGRGIISPNINNAMRLCCGKYINVLFQDDFLYNEESLKKQYNFLKDKTDIDWAMTTFYHSSDGQTYYKLLVPHWNDLIWTGNNTMGCPSGLTIKNKSLLYFDEGLNWLMDVDYYKRMFDKYGKPQIIKEITYVNRTWGSRLCDTIGQELKDKEIDMLNLKYG